MASYSAPVSETVSWVEGALAAHGALAALGETIVVTETRGTAYRAFEHPAEIVGLSDSAAGVPRVHVALPETAGWGESVRAGRPYAAALTETVALSEARNSAARYQSIPKETVALADGVGGNTTHAMSNVLFERVVESASHTTKWGALQPLSDAPVILNEAFALHGVVRSPLADTVTWFEALNAGIPHVTPLSETVALTEAIQAKFKGVQALLETPGIGEGLFTGRHLTAQLAETLSLAELAASKGAGHVAVPETVAFAEAQVFRSRYRSTLSEVAVLAEAANTKQSLKNTGIAETVGLSESTRASRHVAEGLVEPAITFSYTVGPRLNLVDVPLNESYTIAERRRSLATMRSQLGESVTVFDAVGRKYSVAIAFPEMVVIADGVASKITTGKALSETLVLGESAVARPRVFVRPTETVPFSEAITTAASMHSAISEGMRVFATQTNSRGATHAQVTELVALTEAVAFLRNVPQALTETVGVSEGFQVKRRAFFSTGEGYLIFEKANARQVAKSGLAESVAFSEAITVAP